LLEQLRVAGPLLSIWFLATLLTVTLLLHGRALVAHVLGNEGMRAFRNTLVIETARADTTWKSGRYPLLRSLVGEFRFVRIRTVLCEV